MTKLFTNACVVFVCVYGFNFMYTLLYHDSRPTSTYQNQRIANHTEDIPENVQSKEHPQYAQTFHELDPALAPNAVFMVWCGSQDGSSFGIT